MTNYKNIKKVVLRSTFGNRKDVIVYDDDSVDVDGVPNDKAIVSKDDNGLVRVALDPNYPTLFHVNSAPAFAKITIKRVPGWGGKLGWECLYDIGVDGLKPINIALAVFREPEAVSYLFTTGKMKYSEEKGCYTCSCPPGFEPGDEAVHFSLLYGSAPYSAFTLQKKQPEIEVIVGGNLPVELGLGDAVLDLTPRNVMTK